MGMTEEAAADRPKAKKAKKPPKPRPLLEPVSDDGNSSFARALGSVDSQTRERGLQALTLFLESRRDISQKEMRKLWKGLFYCFWHSDKQPVQEELATRMAAILPKLNPEVAFIYFQVFLETMEREWFGIDRLRLDKFLMFLRKFTKQLLIFLEASSWQEELMASYTKVLQALLERSDEHLSAGLSYQLADVTIEELLAVLRESKKCMAERPLKQLLDVFVNVMATTSRTALIHRIRAGVFDPIIGELREAKEAGPLKELNPAALAETVFFTGARQGLKNKSREALYELSRDLEKLSGKKRSRPEADGSAGGSSPVSDSAAEKRTKKSKRNPVEAEKLDDSKASSDEECPQGIPLGSEMANGGPPSQHLDSAASLAKAKRPKTKRKLQRPSESVEAQQPEQSGAAELKSAEELEIERLASAALLKGDTASQPKAKKGKKKRKTPPSEAVNRAADRTLAALNAHKEGKATVDPATPGSPSSENLSGWFEATLASPKSQGASPTSQAAPSPPNGAPKSVKKLKKSKGGTPGGSAKKHVQFALKRNMYLANGHPVPELDVRTPTSCRPKGSALKKVSMFSTPQPEAGNSKKRRAKSRLGRGAKSISGSNIENGAPHSV